MHPKPYLKQHARKLDLHLYEYLFEHAAPDAALRELATYQNADGGFGHALEPDLRLPDSSALATTVALQYMSRLGVKADNALLNKAMDYLVATHNPAIEGWLNIPPAADNFPRAPWWNYKSQQTWDTWGNPSAEILGYLLAHRPSAGDLLHKTRERALKRLHEIGEPEMHEVKCYIRLYKCADKTLQAQLHDLLTAHIKQTVKTNPAEWQGYTATPLTFIDAPDAPFANLFDAQLLHANATYLRGLMQDNSHWEPTWEWGQYPEDWAHAKREWSGEITVDNLCMLQAFGITK